MLTTLKRLRELRISHNPVSETPGMRYLLIVATPKIERLDGLQAAWRGWHGEGGRVLPGNLSPRELHARR